MRLVLSLARLLYDSEYRKNELKTDKRNLLLLFIGLPLACVFILLFFIALPWIFGEDAFFSTIEKVRPFICTIYSGIFGKDICN